MIYDKAVSAIYNDIISGLKGYNENPTISLEQLADDYVDERMQVIKEYTLKGIIPIRDLMNIVGCIDVDCQSMESCPCVPAGENEELVTHFEIPQLLNDFGIDAIQYMGSNDLRLPFVYYYNIQPFLNHQYRKRGKRKPYVFINMAPNANNMLDCWVFNAPFLKRVAVIGLFKDPRQLERYNCCDLEAIDNISVINNEIKRRLTEKKIRYYRQFLAPQQPTDQIPK